MTLLKRLVALMTQPVVHVAESYGERRRTLCQRRTDIAMAAGSYRCRQQSIYTAYAPQMLADTGRLHF